MNIQAQALSFLDTALRVPPLFVMDEVLKCCFGFSNNIHARYSKFLGDENPFLNDEGFGRLPTEDPKNLTEETDTMMAEEEEEAENSFLSATTITKILMFILVYMIATVSFLLTSQRLQQIYLVVASMAIVVAGYQLNMSTMQQITSPPQADQSPLIYSVLSLNGTAILDSGGMVYALGMNYIFQGSLGYLFTILYTRPSYPLLQKLIIMSFLLPSLSVLFMFPSSVLLTIPLCAALLPLAIVKYTVASNLLSGLEVVIDGYRYARRVMRDFGLHALLESEWVRLNVPNVLRTFWLLRVAQHVVSLLTEFMYAKGDYQSVWVLGLEDVYIIFKAVMIQGCETAVALLGMTSVVSYVSHYVGVFFQMILLTVEDDERSMGTVCAILFFILAEQSGLTVMEGEKRFVRLCRNFCLLFTAMLHFIHNMVNPVLMSLSASCNPAMYRHVRALVVCFLLFSLPLLLLYILWSFYPLSTWLLAVSAFSIQVMVKTLVSVLIYTLFLVDAYRNKFWEKLDDYVYYISAFGNSVEFIFGILLFFNGAWIYFFESGGSIRAFMMCIHAYFNIWCEARNGWTVFMKRRTAVKKINSLPEASPAQLSNHDDVCAICFQDLTSARITKCNHYFHSVCLRKWLYVQDSCPLCHEILYKVETPDNPPPQAGDMNGEEGGGPRGGGGPVWDIVAEERQDGTAEPNRLAPAEVPVWGQQDIDVILGERMNGGSREVMIDNEVGEAVIQRPPEGRGTPYSRPHRRDERPPVTHQEPEEQESATEENDVTFVVRRRREYLIDQDIGQ